MQPIEFTKEEISTIENALQCYWMDAIKALQRQDLGDIEKQQYQISEKKSKALMNKIDNHY